MPRILFLDEPTNGLDPEGIGEFYRMLAELRERGTTVILSSHILAEIQQRVDRLALMSKGRIRALGTVQSLRDALKLPLCIDVTLNDGAETPLRHLFAGDGEVDIRISGSNAYLECARDRKWRCSARCRRSRAGDRYPDPGILA